MASKRKRSKAKTGDGQPQKRAKTDGDPKSRTKVQPGAQPNKPVHGVKQDLLGRYFAQVETLRAYLLTRLPATSRLRRKKLSQVGKQADATEVEKLLSHVLDTTLVGCAVINHKTVSDGQPTSDDNDRDRLRETFSQTRRVDESYVTVSSAAEGFFSPQFEIVDFVIWLLFQRTDKTSVFKGPDNVICHGFRFQRDKRPPPAWNSNLETTEGKPSDLPAYAIPNVYVARNPQNAQALKEAPWPQMLAILGASSEKIMTDLLLDCSLFLPVETGDGNYVQLTGKPLFSAVPITDVKVPPSQATKAGTKPKPLSDITFSRSRMFYKKASLTKSAGKVHFGMTRKHVFNRLPYLLEAPCRHLDKKDTPKEAPYLLKLREMVAQNQPVSSLNKEGTIRTAMHLFPRQFGLQNVFSPPTGQVPLALRNFVAREKEIVAKFGGNKTQDKELKVPVPKRLRGTPLDLVEKMRTLHRKCVYPALFKYYCPERHKDSAPGTILVQLATPLPQVSAFCQAVFHNVIPDEFWGSGDIQTHNKAEFFKKVDSFVRLQRHEKLNLHTVLQGLKIAEIPWLAPPKLKYLNLSKTDLEKRREIFAEFVYFLFESFLVPLLATNFYVTESNLHRNRVFYFRHDVWQRISIPAMATIKASRLEKVDAKEATHSELGFGRLRLLPKNSTVRAITNLRHRAPRKGKSYLAPSINTALRPVAAMLAFEMQEHPERLGSGMLSTRGMYSRLKEFKQRMHAKGKRAFYFAKVDVTSAFDTIPQEAMSELLGTVPEHAAYNIEPHVEISATEYNAVHGTSTGSNTNAAGLGLRKTWKMTARPSDDTSGFHDAVKNSMAQNKRNTVFIETASRWTHRAEPLAQKAASHIRKNIVKIGNKFYRQKEGIPQGSVLSAALCSFFYADLEEKELGFLKSKDNASDSEDCLLLRLIDDFLLITVDRAKATRFVEVMQQGHPWYGVSVNPSKSLVNFGLEINGKTVPKLAPGLPFPYCGTTIHCSTLDLAKDRESKPQNLFNSITVEHTRSQGYHFQRRVLNYFQIQSHQMFFDTSFNSRRTTLRNLHSAFAETASKMWAYARCMPKAKRPSVQLTIRTIEEVGGMAFGILNSKMRAQQYPDYKFDVSKPHLRYLLLHAFYVVLGKRQTGYKDVMEYLRDAMRQLQTRGRARLPKEFMLHGTTKI